MTRSKGYTDELEKLNRDDSGLAVTIGLKEAAAKKLRLRITGYSQAEYWYLLLNKGYIISYKNYNISKADENSKWVKVNKKLKKNSEIKQWYLLSYKDQIMSYKKFNSIKPDLLYVNEKINNKKQLMLLNEMKKAL